MQFKSIGKALQLATRRRYSMGVMMSQPLFDVVMIGEINLDLILYGLPAEMLLERELLASDFVTTLGGSSSILAPQSVDAGSFGRLCGCGGAGRTGGDCVEAPARQRRGPLPR